MAAARMKLANLDEASLARIQRMEEQLDTLILALEPYHPLAKLEDAQIKRLQELEQELGVVLLAYQPQQPG